MFNNLTPEQVNACILLQRNNNVSNQQGNNNTGNVKNQRIVIMGNCNRSNKNVAASPQVINCGCVGMEELGVA